MFYSYTILVGSRNGFERDFTIELTYIQGLVEDWFTCQTSLLVNIVKTKTNNPFKCMYDFSTESSCKFRTLIV